VGHAVSLERIRSPADPDLPVDRHARRLAGPGEAALAVRAHGLDRVALLELEIELDAPGAASNGIPAHDHLTAPPGEVSPRPLPEAPALTIPDAPEGHRGGPHLDDRGEDDQVVREGTDPAPALAEPLPEQQRHGVGRDRKGRAAVRIAAPGEPGDLLLESRGLQPRKRRISPAICSPRSSCRKWAAPSIFTWSVTVGIHSTNRSPA